MNVFGLSWRYLWSQPLATMLNLLLLALGLTSMAFVLIARDQIDRAFERDLAGIDVERDVPHRRCVAIADMQVADFKQHRLCRDRC